MSDMIETEKPILQRSKLSRRALLRKLGVAAAGAALLTTQFPTQASAELPPPGPRPNKNIDDPEPAGANAPKIIREPKVPQTETKTELNARDCKEPDVIIEDKIYRVGNPISPEDAGNLYPYLATQLEITANNDIPNLPGIVDTQVLPNGMIAYLFESNLADRDNLVITNRHRPIFKRVIPMSKDNHAPMIHQYLNIYGMPDRILKGSQYHGPFAETYIYASRGIVFIANPTSTEVLEIQTFLPLESPNAYLDMWGADINNFKAPQKIAH
jgi:hypothetical protein